MADGKVEIELVLDDSAAKSKADKLGNEIGKKASASVNGAMKDVNASMQRSVKQVGDDLTSLGTTYSAAVTLPIAAAAVAAGKAAIDIDTSLTGVRKTVDGTEQQYQQLKEKAIEFSKTNAVSASQILDIQALGAQLGYAIDELDMFGEVVSGLDIATNMSAETAATELAQFANIMGMAHEDTKRYGSTIVELGNNFATTEADISAMAMRIAGAGKQIGLSEADVLGLSTALTSMGISAEAGGTAISTIMSQIDKDVALGTEDLETWASTANMSVDEFVKAWGEDAVGALSDVLVGMDKATESGGNMAVILEELGISSIRQTDTMKRLASNSEFLGRAVDTANKAWEENNALDKEVENRNNSMAAQLEILKNKLIAIAEEIGTPLVNALVDVIDAAQPFIDLIESGAKTFSDFDEGTQQLILTAVGMAAAFGPVTGIFGKVISTSQKTRETWASLNNVLFKSVSATQGAASESGKYFAVQKNGETIVYKVNKKTGEYQQTSSRLARTLSTTTAGIKAQTVAQNLSTKAMNLGKIAANGLKAAISSVAPVAIFTIATTAITSLMDAFGRAKEEAESANKTFTKLSDVVIGVGVAADESAESWKKEADAINKLDMEEFRDRHDSLIKSVTESAQNAANSTAMLKSYGDSINELAGRSDLTKSQIAELKLAVDGVNEALGTGYTVAQDQDGAWRIMADGAEVAKDKILDLIEAQMQQIRFEATKEQYKAVYAEMAQDAADYQNAIDDLTRAQEEYDAAYADFREQAEQGYGEQAAYGLMPYEEALQSARDRLEEVKEKQNDTTEAATRLEEQMKLSALATSEGASEFLKSADASLIWKAAVQSTGVDLVAFTTAMDEAGMSAGEMAALSSEQIQSLASIWAESVGSMATNTGDQGREASENLAAGISEGEGDVTTAARNTAETVNKEISSSVEKMDGYGREIGSNLASGIRSEYGNVDSATRGLAEIVAKYIKHSVPKAGPLHEGGFGERLWGQHIVQNITEGMLDERTTLVRAMDAISETIKDGIEDGIVIQVDAQGREIARGLVVGFEDEDPAAQMVASIEKGVAVATVVASAGMSVYNNTNKQTVNFNQPVQSPDEITRAMRMEQRYGLAGSYR